jgi:hypothetical protein
VKNVPSDSCGRFVSGSSTSGLLDSADEKVLATGLRVLYTPVEPAPGPKGFAVKPCAEACVREAVVCTLDADEARDRDERYGAYAGRGVAKSDEVDAVLLVDGVRGVCLRVCVEVRIPKSAKEGEAGRTASVESRGALA